MNGDMSYISSVNLGKEELLDSGKCEDCLQRS